MVVKDVLNTISSFHTKATDASAVKNLVKAIKLGLSSESQLEIFNTVKKLFCNGKVSSCDKNFIFFLDMMPKNSGGLQKFRVKIIKQTNATFLLFLFMC